MKVATVNILSDLSHWEERSLQLVRGLAEAGPDIVALQEVNLLANTAGWLAEKLNYPYLHLTPKMGKKGKEEGIAILSRLPFEEQANLDLKTQYRVAQYVRVRLNGRSLTVANGHLFWQPGDSTERLLQVERLLDWLGPFLNQLPVVVCGDFNAHPGTKAFRRMRQELTSAYAAVHGDEPEYTFPTPLPRSKEAMLRTLFTYWHDIRLGELRLKMRGVLDYIFVNGLVRVIDSQLILDKPAPGNPKLFASDHYGLMAVLEF